MSFKIIVITLCQSLLFCTAHAMDYDTEQPTTISITLESDSESESQSAWESNEMVSLRSSYNRLLNIATTAAFISAGGVISGVAISISNNFYGLAAIPISFLLSFAFTDCCKRPPLCSDSTVMEEINYYRHENPQIPKKNIISYV